LLPALELLGHLAQARADPLEVLVHGAQPDVPRRLAGQARAGGGLGLHGAAELELRRRLLVLGTLERGLPLLEGPDGPGPLIRRPADLLVERVQALAGLLAAGEPFVPAGVSAFALGEQVAQARRGQAHRDRVGLGRELLVAPGHLGLLLERLELPPEL